MSVRLHPEDGLPVFGWEWNRADLRLDLLEAEGRHAIKAKLPMVRVRRPEPPKTLEEVVTQLLAAEEAATVASLNLLGPDGRPLKETPRVHRV